MTSQIRLVAGAHERGAFANGALRSLKALIILLASLVSLPRVHAQEVQRDRELVRAARARSNEAFAARDTVAMRRQWLPNITVITSTGTQLRGADAYAAAMAATYRLRPDAHYVRTPSAVDHLASWEVASEQGTWVGRWTEPDGPVEVGGTYLARWQLVDGGWHLEAELFVPTYCRGGAYCARRPQ